MEKQTIFLVGFMGSGKTTIGEQLAAHLQRDFIDLDEMIVKRTGRSIAEIFAKEGEAYFRALEREMLTELKAHTGAVVALGGGAFVSEQNQAIIAAQGWSIWLDCQLEIILARLGDDHTRPLYTSRSRAELVALLESRRPAYAQAYIRLDVSALTVIEAVEKLIQLLAQAKLV
ncbi:MAG: shikimate kinase [Acidobacteriota bacterium]